MKKLFFIIGLFFSLSAAAQPTNYTKINMRYRWLSGMFDSALYVPRYNGTPSGVRVNETSVFDGMVAMDTTNNRLYIYSGGGWVRLANYTEIANIYNSDGTLTGDRTVIGGGNRLIIDSTKSIELVAINSESGTRVSKLNLVPKNDNTEGLRLSYEDLLGESYISMQTGLIEISTSDAQLFVKNIPYTLSTTGKKILIRDTATGLVQNIDPALIGGTPAGSTKQFQYNNAGAFAGSSMLTQETDQILITGNSAASTPPFEVNAHVDLTSEIINVKQSGTKKFSFHSNGSIELAETTDPTAAATGYNRLYAQAGKLYTHNDDGRVAQVVQTLQLTFGAGSGADSDTTAFTTSAIYGSFYNDADTIVVTSMRSVLQGTSPDVTYKVWYNDSLNVEAGATALVTAGSQVTNTTTGTNVTSFDVTKIPPGVWVWVKTSTVATKPKYFSLTVNGYRK